MRVAVIFENSRWLAVDKPAEWLTVPGRFGTKDERPCLGPYLQQSRGQEVFPVHRLDFEVSGLVLFALDREAHRRANTWFEERKVKKTYEALTLGPVDSGFGEWQTWRSKIVRGKRRSFVANHGQVAITEAVFVGLAKSNWARWKLHPLTGRSHQLRVELARHGFPIIGDDLYGAQEKWSGPGIALRAVELDFSAIGVGERFALPDRLLVPGLSMDHIPSM